MADTGGREIDQWTSLTHINAELQRSRSAELLAWHQVKSQEREATIQGFYVPSAKSSMSLTLGEALKKYAMRYYQLKIRHGAVGTYLVRIGVMETPECWWCRAQQQTVVHLYTECRRWRRERRKLNRELGRLGIGWQPRPERRWLGNLLANERAVRPKLQFLKDTEVGNRDEARRESWNGREGKIKKGKTNLLD